MKLKEKLAENYVDSFTADNECAPVSNETADFMLMAYLAGFEKAREMAIHTMSDTPHAVFRLQNLGEEEVE